MRSRTIYVRIFFMAFLLTCCVEPYTPEGVQQNPDFLVVDGFINASTNSGTVKLTKAIGLNSDEEPPVVIDAQVTVESDAGDIFPLYLAAQGAYEGPVEVDYNKKYRLNIVQGFGREYESDFIEIQKVPDIESINLQADDDALRFMVNTEPSEESSKFYRWRFDETWEFTSTFSSAFILQGGTARLRSPDEYISRCYRTDPSSAIKVASTDRLVTNAIKNFEVHAIGRSSIKLGQRYSMKLQQFALTEEAYSYWLKLYKTNENVGSLFDPMPGQVLGNVRSKRNPNEVVIGFFSGSMVSEKRIFVTRQDLPEDYVTYRPLSCQLDSIDVEFIPYTPESVLLVSAIYTTSGFPTIIAYTTSEARCIDCVTYGGGSRTKPDFWP